MVEPGKSDSSSENAPRHRGKRRVGRGIQSVQSERSRPGGDLAQILSNLWQKMLLRRPADPEIHETNRSRGKSGADCKRVVCNFRPQPRSRGPQHFPQTCPCSSTTTCRSNTGHFHRLRSSVLAASSRFRGGCSPPSLSSLDGFLRTTN